jgi:hypothetical protein
MNSILVEFADGLRVVTSRFFVRRKGQRQKAKGKSNRGGRRGTRMGSGRSDRGCATKLTAHQKRVLAALLELQRANGWKWWSRCSIGRVIAAGGFHGTIQNRTMSVLKKGGLVQTERSSWPTPTAARIRCTCACCEWGLTAAGEKEAAALSVFWCDDTLQRIEGCLYDHAQWFRDEDEPPPGWRDDGDDDGDDDAPTLCPAGSGGLQLQG